MPHLVGCKIASHRVPPDIRILTPGRPVFSSSSTRAPASAALIAAVSPAAPAPTTATSWGGSRSRRVRVGRGGAGDDLPAQEGLVQFLPRGERLPPPGVGLLEAGE